MPTSNTTAPAASVTRFPFLSKEDQAFVKEHKKKLCEAILGNERSLLQDLEREDLEVLLR